MTRHYRDLIAWQKAMQLVTEIYQVTRKFPDDEKFGLISQLRRAAVSVPSNIAEGQARNSIGDFRRFLNISRGSIAEVETQLMIAEKLGFIDSATDTIQQAKEVGRIISGLIKSLAS